MKNIQDFFTIYKQSAWDKDTKSMIALYHNDVKIFDMWMEGFQTGLSGWANVINDWLGSLGDERVKVSFENIEIQEGDKVAFGNAVITFQAISTNDTVIRGMKNRITVGFIKDNNQWKVIHQHTSAPINFELKAILDF